MKTKRKFLIATCLLIMASFSSKAQYVLQNNLNCDVTVNWEMWDAPCGVCSFSTDVVPAGQSITLTNCPAFTELCIVIMDIAGWTPPLNHTSLNTCHSMTPYGQIATGLPVGCSNTGNYNVTQTTTQWVINP